MSPDEILKLLGVRAVLLPIRKGTKAPTRRRWQSIQFPETQKAAYQASLTRAPAIGVSQGAASDGLCSIDCDDADFLDEILALNPLLAGTLRTAAKRGGNLWFIVNGSPPPSRKLKRGGSAVGEFRSTGNHTLIAGKHPEGLSYRMIVKAPPVRIDYASLQWPSDLATHPLPLNSSEYSSPSPSSASSPSLRSLHNIGEKIKGEASARESLQKQPGLAKLYGRWIERNFTPRQGSRNQDAVSMVTFLFRATGETCAELLAQSFHTLNQSVFIDSAEQHAKEIRAHLEACRLRWLEELSESERQLVANLPKTHEETFRICRDLSERSFRKGLGGEFLLSFGDLADRLRLSSVQAQRIMSAFESHGLVEMVAKGTRHTKGERGQATRWRYRFQHFTELEA